jgi:hypothetical protein
MELKEREEWACANIEYKGIIDLFSKGKSGNYKEQRVTDNYLDKIKYNEEVVKVIEQMGFTFIDAVTKTMGEEGTHLRGTDTDRWVNMSADNISRYDINGAARPTGLVPFGDPNNKKAGEIKIILGIKTKGDKWSQLHIEGDELQIKTYSSKRSFNDTKKLTRLQT